MPPRNDTGFCTKIRGVLQTAAVSGPTSNAVELENKAAVVGLSLATSNSSPLHCCADGQSVSAARASCSPIYSGLGHQSASGSLPADLHCDGQSASTALPASPIFGASFAAEAGRDADLCRSFSPPAPRSPVASERRLQSALFSPPTDMDTDVSAIVGQVAEDSRLWKSDVSFEVR